MINFLDIFNVSVRQKDQSSSTKLNFKAYVLIKLIYYKRTMLDIIFLAIIKLVVDRVRGIKYNFSEKLNNTFWSHCMLLTDLSVIPRYGWLFFYISNHLS